ncbi:MAG: FAD-binding oxidoreductase [Actinomycetota bacterium]|nr:FAD-binding oxidoreductase [Actinomycetota bacterium]
MASSLWANTLPDGTMITRASLPGDTDADVAIVGAGYTGLWTAYALLSEDPALRVIVCERDHVGFGASGRNGGWCQSAFAGPRPLTEKLYGRDAVIAMQRAMFANLYEIERVVTDEGIDCDWALGGTVEVATIRSHVDRIEQQLAGHKQYGFGDDDYRWLTPDESSEIIGCTPNLGAQFSPHCSAIHPAKLAHGVAAAVERKGGVIYERTPVTKIGPGRVTTTHGTVRTDVVVRATEAFSPGLPGFERTVVPIYSLMIATEPLPAAFWADAKLDTRPTFTDGRMLLVYGQRTADNRFAFGGRGAPYHFGSKVESRFDQEPAVFEDLKNTLWSLFPALGDAAVTHRWGGAVAMPRDWYPSVGLDRATGIAWGGGYVGDGVSTAHLAGRTLADLILKRDTDRVQLPWVGHTSPKWEPEPLRWLGIRGMHALVASADKAAAAGRPPGRVARLVAKTFGT